MPLDSDHAIDPPLRPPEPAEPGLWRWLVAAALVLVIIVGAYQAYEWLVNDVARRRAVAVAPAPASTQHPAPDTGAPTAEPARRTIRPAQPSAPPRRLLLLLPPSPSATSTTETGLSLLPPGRSSTPATAP